MPHQIFYTRPYTPLREFTILIITCTAFACVNVYTTIDPGDTLVSFSLHLLNGCLAGSAVAICFYNIVFDPDWTKERRVGGGCADSEAGGAGVGAGGGGSGSGSESRGDRVVKVRRPIMGYKYLERRVETEDEVWEDGFRYERAMFRI